MDPSFLHSVFSPFFFHQPNCSYQLLYVFDELKWYCTLVVSNSLSSPNCIFILLAAQFCRPENFKSSIIDNSWGKVEGDASTQDETELKLSDDGGELTTTDDDELPPIEANTNRRKPSELQSDTESDSETDS